MSDIDIVSELEAALAEKSIPENARKRGQALFETLSRPVRVALLGPEGGGKSTLVNLILGERVLPESCGARFVEIVPGDTFLAEASWSDGRLEAPEEDELADIEDADRLLIAAPHPILRRIGLIEARSDDPDAVAEVTESADIILWCTPMFGQTERNIWAGIQEAFRDHAFLVLTKADKLARKNRLAEVLSDLQGIAESEFAGLFPVATLQGLNALDEKPRDDGLWTGSGAEALVSALLEHAGSGRQADLDQAELFLARYGLDSGAEDDAGSDERPRSRSRSRPRSQTIRRRSRLTRQPSRPSDAAEAPADAPGEEPADTTATVAAPTTTAPTDAAPGEVPAAEPGQTTLADRLGEVRRNPSSPVARKPDIVEAALTRLKSTGDRLSALPDEPEKVLALCVDTADALQSIIDESPLPADLAGLADDVAQTSEMMTLLQLENAPGPAADAVTLLLQIKRDLEQSRAA